MESNQAAKHSPGPWISQNCSQGIDIYRGGEDTFGNKVATVCGASTDRPFEKTIANARLITAAPELLDALRGLMIDAPRQGTKYPMPERWAKAYAILVKVEGK